MQCFSLAMYEMLKQPGERAVSKFTRSVFLVILIPASMALGSSSIAQPAEGKAKAPARTNVDGKFAHYLESPGGEIDGVVLEDGTIARFAPFKRTVQAAPFRFGDSIRVTGDVVSGLAGPYLVHALVMTVDVPTTRGAVSPPPAGAPGIGSRSRHGGKGVKGSLKDSPQTPRAAGKPHGPSVDQARTVDNLLVVEKSSVRARKKGRLEGIGASAREATTGKGKSASYSPWSRAQETAGP